MTCTIVSDIVRSTHKVSGMRTVVTNCKKKREMGVTIHGKYTFHKSSFVSSDFMRSVLVPMSPWSPSLSGLSRSGDSKWSTAPASIYNYYSENGTIKGRSIYKSWLSVYTSSRNHGKGIMVWTYYKGISVSKGVINSYPDFSIRYLTIYTHFRRCKFTSYLLKVMTILKKRHLLGAPGQLALSAMSMPRTSNRQTNLSNSHSLWNVILLVLHTGSVRAPSHFGQPEN